MAEESKPNNFANNSLILAALFSVGALVIKQFPPLEGERPLASVAQLHETASAQDLDTRLWQDPFSVVAPADADLAVAGDCPDRRGVDHCKTPLEQLEEAHDLEPSKTDGASPKGQEPGAAMPTERLIVWVTVSGAPYFAEEEQRRRLRYAVVSALDTRGYAPANSTHIGYFHPHRKQILEQPSIHDSVSAPDSNA
jgi:hypothetical protein